MPKLNALILRTAACLSALAASAGCNSSDAKANAALGEYQSAAASNDLFAARQALLKLVLAKDDVADYWVELGKVQSSLGSYGDAYYAFTRAYELDRSNPDLVRALTEMALRAGDLAGARQHADELAVLAPNDPWVRLAKGWAAIAELHYDQALAESEAMLASSPGNAAATLLKGRALMGLDRPDDAISLLTQEIQAQPSDQGSLSLLVKIYQQRGDWVKASDYAGRLAKLTPGDAGNGENLIESSFQAGEFAQGRQASLQLLQPNAPAGEISAILDRWATDWPSAQRIEDAKRLAEAAPGIDQKLAYAAFLSRMGSPADAQQLSEAYATLPVTARSAEANAVVGDALLRSGNLAGAKARLDAVIAFDPGNATALRARAELGLHTGHASSAVQDAQRLVTVLPNSARDRILLSQILTASGDRQGGMRALWVAFHDIPANRQIFSALQATRKGNPEAMNDLKAEFDRQLQAKLTRGLL